MVWINQSRILGSMYPLTTMRIISILNKSIRINMPYLPFILRRVYGIF